MMEIHSIPNVSETINELNKLGIPSVLTKA